MIESGTELKTGTLSKTKGFMVSVLFAVADML